jgi:hypothetical protein
MTEGEIDRRLIELLARPAPESDPAFVDRIALAARIELQLSAARRRNLIRALIDCAAVAAVGASFYLMSQMSGAGIDGIIAPAGPAMAGLIMLAIWSTIALPAPRNRLSERTFVR